jgi:hypothetical protein
MLDEITFSLHFYFVFDFLHICDASAHWAQRSTKRIRERGPLSGCSRSPNGPKRMTQRVRLDRRVGDALTHLREFLHLSKEK